MVAPLPNQQTSKRRTRGTPGDAPTSSSALQNALEVVESKNQELRSLIGQYQLQQLQSNINLLSMTLNGVIDAAVNGGIARYQEVSA